MKIITGYRGEPHITSHQDRNVNIGIFGSGTHIVNVGSKMAATIVSANEITIADGLLVAEGCTAEIERGTTESISIENGAQEMLRKDLIVARYTKTSSTGVEDMQLAYIAGTPAASAPALPSYNEGSIANGDTLVDFPLYTVNINGISVESVVCMVDEVTLASAADVTELTNKIGTTTMGTAATTITAAIKELLTKINTNITNITAAVRRITSLEDKTEGIVGTKYIVAEANSTKYIQLHESTSYIIFVSANALDNGLRGLYMVGVNSDKHIGIKTISAAGNIEMIDAGSVAGNYTGVMRVKNNGATNLRMTIITTFGTAL